MPGAARRGASRRGRGCAWAVRGPGWGRAGAGLPQEAPGRWRGRDSRPSGGEATTASADWPVPVLSEGRAWLCAAVPGAEVRGVALWAGRAALGGRGGGLASPGLHAPGFEGRDPPLPGRRETAPETPARVYPAAGLRPPRRGRESGRPELKREQACRRQLPGEEVSLCG